MQRGAEGATLYLERDRENAFTIGTLVNGDLNTISGIPADELRRLGNLFLEAADETPFLVHATACPANEGSKCVCRAEE